ncbi:hypothetical protein [Paraburkholderia diazotrophica]|uniref:PRC-barrel domain-containing protein n=1 Tax=Paraburkholderia diazotrophica TaxID=667676 RepID=A0A1H6WJ71_9BURK|nr:hypothetical protein [Paraburkholderia diazotrophica]SEJ14157.1 hypothetical protein SAMN05192539_100739 [Paraburkholderia diazotrophica]
MKHVNVDLALGRQVLSRDGKRLGHIEAIKVVRDGDAWLISEFHVGPDALLERLAVGLLPRVLREAVQRKGRSRRHRIAWHQIDVTDPRHPRLVCDKADLQGSAHDAATERETVPPRSSDDRPRTE